MTEQRYRFVVSSAEEALTVLRERLGEHARVISVRQIEGSGLSKFLKAPKLEVIAEKVPPPENAPVEPASAESAEAASSDAVATPPATVPKVEAPPPSSPLTRLLRAGGVAPPVIARLQAVTDWGALDQLAPGDALARIGMKLREEFRAIPRRALGNRTAFVGTAGAGTTSALCKWLATEVFVRRRSGAVLKLDLDRANPSDALAVFCEALGVACIRSVNELSELPADELVLVDLPGLTPRIEDDAAMSAALDAIGTTSRVLVVNAAYETALIKRAYDFARKAGCTHVVFTHLDELAHWGKLWEFLLAPDLTPLFLGTGPNIAGDLDENVFDTVLARTFPGGGVQAAESGEPS